MRLHYIILALAVSGCGNLGQYSCGGKIRCDDPDTELSKFSDRWITGKEQRDQEAAQRARSAAKLAECNRKGLDTRPKLLDDQTVDKIKNMVLDQLKDPESARFRKIQGLSEYAICTDRAKEFTMNWIYEGEVNAKNSYGGYTGFTKFYSNGTSVYISTVSY